MTFKVSTLKIKGGHFVIIKRAKNTTSGGPCYDVDVILCEDKQCGLYRGAYSFKVKGFYQGEEELAAEAISRIKKELEL